MEATIHKIFLRMCWIGTALGIVSCAQSPNTQALFDPSVPSNQAQLLQGDLSYLHTSNIAAPDPDQLRVLDVQDFQSASLEGWLYERVKVIVGEGFNWQVQGQETPIAPNEQPQLMSQVHVRDSSDVETVMQNLGAMLYLQSKPDHAVYMLNMAEGEVRVNTPRVGIIQIGEGLFDGANQIPGSPPDSEANSILRLAAVFHEARHGDGNGNYAAFPHAVCPSGDYAGDAACEMNLDGPYAVQALMLQQMYMSCQTCSQDEQQGLLVLLADYQGRLLPDATWHDDTPEELP